MAAIMNLGDIAKKWATITPMHSGDYETGIQNPRRSWERSTMAAEASWGDGVRAAVSNKSFSKGVSKAGDEKWQKKALTKGVRNWGPGVSEAQSDYEAGFAPFHAAISALTLPPRYARRDPRNLARVKAVCDAMIAKKLSLN